MTVQELSSRSASGPMNQICKRAGFIFFIAPVARWNLFS
jgi:hypothetical protein